MVAVPKPNQNYIEKRELDDNGRKRTYIYGLCKECGEEYKKRKDLKGDKKTCNKCVIRIAGEKRRGRIYEKSRTGENKKCKVCEREFYVKKCHLTTKKFCSWDCYNKWMKDNPRTDFMTALDTSGKNNAQYKHGKYAGKRTHYRGNKRNIKEELIERDGGKECLLCGIPGDGLHMHRVIYGSQGGKYETKNCVQLCGVDHSLVHSSKKTWLEPLLEYLNDPSLENRRKLINLRIGILKDEKERKHKRKELKQYYEGR